MYETFASRVASVRDGWQSRRHLKHLNLRHDREARFELLLTIYEWAGEAIGTIEVVYDGAIVVDITPIPDANSEVPSFSVGVEADYRIVFWLTEGTRKSGLWDIHAEMRTPDGAAAAAPSRRAGQWTQARIEELLLTLLAAVEREFYEDVRVPLRESRAG